MWEEEKEFEIFEEIEDYEPGYDNTDVFSFSELDPSDSIIENENVEDFEYDDDSDYDYEEQ